MKGQKKTIITIAAVLMSLALALPLFGEVSAQVDGNGEFNGLNLTTKFSQGHVEYWSRTMGLPDSQVLNSDGDSKGDGKPVGVVTSRVVGELTTAANDMAYVVWPSHQGDGDRLLYAYFVTQSWGDPGFVPHVGDDAVDRDPSLIERRGKLYLAWWTDEAVSKVYYSTYDGNHWSSPLLVSDPGVPSGHPALQINSRCEIVIVFQSYSENRTTTTSLILEDCDP